jgi:GNAT superfamily N-acetyltransferase
MIRFASALDADALATIAQRYVEDTFSAEWGGAESRLRVGLDSRLVRVLIAHHEAELIGFAALVGDYDLHHCVAGLRVIDLYVVPAQRGRGVAAGLLAHVAHHALSEGLSYVRGEAAPSPEARRLFERVALRIGDSYRLSGQALRVLAEQRDSTPRDLVRSLPSPESNREA